ncbi:MAG: peptide ABC transporter substrate-binding protein [Armatimonadetes bacterium]|nr:peptide ABC transporter substrate-binding protein [Armatimonadota bacterium]
MSRRFVTALVLLAVVTLAAPALPARAGEAPRREVVIGMLQEPDTYNPTNYTTLAAHTTFPIFLSPTVTYNEKWQLVPVLVEDIPTVQNGGVKVLPDGRMHVTWKLRQATWHDGRPITSEDAVFTNRVVKDKNIPIYVRQAGDFIENIVAHDARTLTVTFNKRYAFANADITDTFILPRHILQSYHRQGAKALREAAYGKDPAVTVGSGPFIFKSWRQGSEIVFEANPNYFRGRPALDRVVIKLFSDVSALVANIVAGAVDIGAPPPVGIAFAQGLQVEELIRQGRARGLKVDYRPTLVQDGLYFNVTSPFLQDRRVRQAIAYAVDREGISKALFQGKQPAAHSFLPENHPLFYKDIRKYSLNLERARGFMREAGWTPGPDGVLRSARGERFAISVMTTAGNSTRERVQQILQVQLRELGIELSINNVPSRTFLSRFWYARRYPHLAIISHGPQNNLNVDRTYGSWNIQAVGEYSTNTMGWKNDEADRLMKVYEEELDDAKRGQILKDLQKVWAEEVPALLLYQWTSASTVKEGLLNYRPSGTSSSPGPYTWNVQEWRWR